MTREFDITYDLVAVQYLEALEQGDWKTVQQLWERAEKNTHLAASLSAIDEGLLEECGWTDKSPHDAGAVRDLLQQHFPQRVEPVEAGELTASNVAMGLLAKHERGDVGLTDDELQMAEQLRGNATPLPDRITRSSFDTWTPGLGLEASPQFWREFRRVAALMKMSRDQNVWGMAARDATRPGRKDDNAN